MFFPMLAFLIVGAVLPTMAARIDTGTPQTSPAKLSPNAMLLLPTPAPVPAPTEPLKGRWGTLALFERAGGPSTPNLCGWTHGTYKFFTQFFCTEFVSKGVTVPYAFESPTTTGRSSSSTTSTSHSPPVTSSSDAVSDSPSMSSAFAPVATDNNRTGESGSNNGSGSGDDNGIGGNNDSSAGGPPIGLIVGPIVGVSLATAGFMLWRMWRRAGKNADRVSAPEHEITMQGMYNETCEGGNHYNQPHDSGTSGNNATPIPNRAVAELAAPPQQIIAEAPVVNPIGVGHNRAELE
ncbi:hypothetical protein SLS62_003124 [Diatrype stigma]|uniref:Uncharacterized protein n=1 Tax=Diatrype stigma TaxID=117547 RepID=A0AAN9UYW5_9PEZI